MWESIVRALVDGGAETIGELPLPWMYPTMELFEIPNYCLAPYLNQPVHQDGENRRMCIPGKRRSFTMDKG